MLCQSSRQDIHQLRQHVEAALTGFHALLLQLLVKSFDYDRNLGDRTRKSEWETQVREASE